MDRSRLAALQLSCRTGACGLSSSCQPYHNPECVDPACRAETVVMSSGELEHEWAGTPGKLIRERYRKVRGSGVPGMRGVAWGGGEGAKEARVRKSMRLQSCTDRWQLAVGAFAAGGGASCGAAGRGQIEAQVWEAMRLETSRAGWHLAVGALAPGSRCLHATLLLPALAPGVQASEMSKVRGKMTALLIHDIDAGLGHFDHVQVRGRGAAAGRDEDGGGGGEGTEEGEETWRRGGGGTRAAMQWRREVAEFEAGVTWELRLLGQAGHTLGRKPKVPDVYGTAPVSRGRAAPEPNLLTLTARGPQVTVNNQIVIGTLMNICDNPNGEQLSSN